MRRHKLDIQQRVVTLGLAADQAVTLMMTGRSAPMLALFDPKDLQLKAFLRSDR